MSDRVRARVDGRDLPLSNLDKLRYPECGLSYSQQAVPADAFILLRPTRWRTRTDRPQWTVR